MNKWYLSLGAVLLIAVAMQAQEVPQQSSETRVIIIEEKTDRWGNKSVTRTERSGNFSDEEIERIIAEESQSQADDHAVRPPFALTERGYLGVMVENADSGARIIEVREGSPALTAGLQNGDIISSVNDVPVTDMESLVRAVGENKPGDLVTVHYSRDGAQATSDITLGSRREAILSRTFGEDEATEEMRRHEMEMHRNDIEMRRSEMEARRNEMETRRHERHLERDQFMLDDKAERLEKEKSKAKPRFGVSIDDMETGPGVIVTEVHAGSVAAQAGLQKGDVITTFNGIVVNSPDALIEAVKNTAEGEKVKVQYTRDGKKLKEKVVL